MKRDPTDPLSGVLLSTYDVVGNMMLGLVAGPVELGKQTMLRRVNAEHKKQRVGQATADDTKGVPHVAGQVALGTAKGIGRIVTTTLKSPAIIMHGITRGFHNLPKAYGEEVRQYENVTGLRSGLSVSAKSFGYGFKDGFGDLLVKPYEGAEKSGIVGLGTGIAKGLANAALKPTAGQYPCWDSCGNIVNCFAGVCGLLSYSMVGIYKSIRNVGTSKEENPINVVRTVGDVEYQQASDADKLYIVRLWCHTQMRVRIG
jgi:hypothetical protein